MKTYKVTYVVELPEESYANWSEQNDVYFSIMLEVDKGNASMVEVLEVPNGSMDKYTIFDEAGGI